MARARSGQMIEDARGHAVGRVAAVGTPTLDGHLGHQITSGLRVSEPPGAFQLPPPGDALKQLQSHDLFHAAGNLQSGRDGAMEFQSRKEERMERESRWTAPSPDCPQPELWHAPDRAATEVEVSQFLAALCIALRPASVLETGAYKGHTSRAIGSALVGIGHLDSLEIDAALAKEARIRVEELPVSVHCVSSLEFVPRDPLDLIFFDSEYHLRRLEIARFRAFASNRCVWALHDSRHEALRVALRELREAGLIGEVIHLPTPRGLALGRYVHLPDGPENPPLALHRVKQGDGRVR
jgi:hypothetical protein